MGYEVIGMVFAGSVMVALVFYMIKFVIDVLLGKYRTED